MTLRTNLKRQHCQDYFQEKAKITYSLPRYLKTIRVVGVAITMVNFPFVNHAWQTGWAGDGACLL